MRDKLIELIGDAPYGLRTLGQTADELISVEGIADYLISSGVTVAEEDNVPNKKPGPGCIQSVTATECDGYTQVLIDFEWEGCNYPIVSKLSHSEIVGMGYEKKRRWIPVSERLPDEDGRYLVRELDYKKRPYVDCVYFAKRLDSVCEYSFEKEHRSGWYGFDSRVGYYERDSITHWMSLPELPEEGEA